MKAAIVYDVFPHYREGILDELSAHSEHSYVLAAGRRSLDATIKTARLPEGVEYVVCPCIELPGGAIYQGGLIRLALRRDLQAIIYLGCPSLLSTWLSAAVARCAGKQVLYWTHGWLRRDARVRGIIKRIFYRLAHTLLLYGNIAKELGMEVGFDAAQMHVIYNSLNYKEQARIRETISAEDCDDMRRALFIDADLPLVICTARLTAACRFELLFAAQRILMAEGTPFNVVLVGDGPQRKSLEMNSQDLGSHVRFYGECYDEETLGKLIMAADVAVSPGKVGLTAMHSLAFGTPVITHDNPEHQRPEVEAIVPGMTGDLFREGDAASLAAVIRKWICDGASSSKRSACIQVIEEFYNPVYQRVVIDRALRGECAQPLTTVADGMEQWRRENGSSQHRPDLEVQLHV